MSNWPSSRARRVLAALQRVGWVIKRQSGSHREALRSPSRRPLSRQARRPTTASTRRFVRSRRLLAQASRPAAPRVTRCVRPRIHGPKASRESTCHEDSRRHQASRTRRLGTRSAERKSSPVPSRSEAWSRDGRRKAERGLGAGHAQRYLQAGDV